jgi:voltage-gated potassium channel Kch
VFRFEHEQSVKVALLMAQAGEFGFVLYAAAQANGVLQPDHGSILVALTVMSMGLAPFLYRLWPYFVPKPKDAAEREEDFTEAKGSVLVIGFGRFGQIACQMLLAEGVDVTVIDNDVEMIEAAERFIGFKVYYGDGSRYDVLRAAGAGEARLILVCTDKPETTSEIVGICKTAFPLAQIFARSFDRVHALDLIEKGVDYQIRETFESALRFGGAALTELDLTVERVQAVEEDVRQRDRARFAAQRAGDPDASRNTMYNNTTVRPEPLVPSRRAKRDKDDVRPTKEAQDIDGGAGL